MSEEISVKTRRPGLSHSAMMKVFVFILAIVFLAAAVAGGIATAFCLSYEVYYTDEAELREDLLGYSAAHYGLAWMALMDNPEGIEGDIEGSNVALAKIQVCGDVEATYTLGAYSGGERFQRVYGYRESPHENYINYASNEYHSAEGVRYDIYYNGNQIPEGAENYIVVTVWMDPEPAVYDHYFLGSLAIDLAYDWCWWFIALALGGLLGFILCLVFLCRAAGRRRKIPQPCGSWATKVPFDLATAAAVGAVCLLIALMIEVLYWEDLFSFVLGGVSCIGIAVIGIWWIMSFALRIKLGILIKNTVIFMVLRFIWRCCKAVGGLVRAFFNRLGSVWWAALTVCALAVVEFIVIMATEYSLGAEVLLWLLKTVILLAAAVFLAWMLRELQNVASALARGETDCRADTRFMPPPLKRSAEDLASLGRGIDIAVEQRMKSERMKTELITNVSHDIKTPLTSIINYADLICREETENPTIHEHAKVLQRQSDRLKRLLEDLVEASKASSGNMDINLAPCQVGVLLMQVAGEYEQRLQERNLNLVASQPVHELRILADGKRLWRVMDNLMGNICKYALPGTRVYLSLEHKGDQAVVSFKNTSAEMLNMEPDELMERFVRGDSARHGEGSGLGLSIARSLTELQGGRMDIFCDGDLFKVVLSFPVIK